MKLLERLHLEASQAKRWFPELAELMKRRHLIVHRADRSGSVNVNEATIQDIDPAFVLKWSEAVVNFIMDILPQTVEKQLKV